MIIKETCTKGTNIYFGNEKRSYINRCIHELKLKDFIEIQIPILQEYKWFENKVGEENNNMMYRFNDRAGRELCLAPEYTSIVMNLKDTFKYQKDVRLFYVAECFRGENTQRGRYRQFTQLGVEILNPSDESIDLPSLALNLCAQSGRNDFLVDKEAKRGLDYYKDGKGFEIRLPDNLQIVGGGAYEGGEGFAIGVDRLLNTLT